MKVMLLISSTVLLLITAQFAASTRIIIVTAPSNPCHGFIERNGLACFTLEQFVSSQISFQNLTLEMESGIHELQTTFYRINSSSLEIIGNNATIVCQRRLYYSFSLNFQYLQAVNISGVTFVNCSRIYMYMVSNVTVSESNFLYGIYSRSLELWYATRASVRSCTFVGRSSRTTTGLYLYQIRAPVNFTIESCVFVGHYYGVQLGYTNRNVFIQSCNFFDNKIGIQQTASLNTAVNSSTFIGNRQSIYITSGRIVIYNSTFRSNGNSSFAGSVLYSSRSGSGAVMIMNSSIINNTASNGAIYIRDIVYSSWSVNRATSLMIETCTFINNMAYGSGGAVYIEFFGSSSLSRAYYPPNRTISNSVFINNRATVSGGAISVAGNLSIVDTIFGYNNAPHCAVLQVSPSFFEFNNVTLLSSTFLYNKAINSTSANNIIVTGLGGVACFQNISVTVNNGTFSHNTAAGVGGVMVVEGSNITISSSLFRNNTAGIDGGVLYTRFLPSNYTITQSSFTSNRAGDDGGVIYSGGLGNNVVISECTFSHNTATDRGGAIITFRGTFEIISTNMFTNRANYGIDVAICSAPNISTYSYFNNFAVPTHSSDFLCSYYSGYVRIYSVPFPDDRSNVDISHYLLIPGAVSNRTMITVAPRLSDSPTTFERLATTTEDQSLKKQENKTTTVPRLSDNPTKFGALATNEDQSLKKLENKLVETSVVVYIFFSLALVIVITLMVAFVVKFCVMKKTKRGSMNKECHNTAVLLESTIRDDDNFDNILYDQPTWKDNPPNAIPLKPNVVYSKK